MPKKRPLQVDDLYRLQLVEDPHISPDGRHIAFVKASIDRIGNQYTRSIWLTTLRAGQPPATRQFTFGAKSDTSPRWSPDGMTLAFVSRRGDKPQIYLIGLDGGEARPLTAMLNGAGNPVWSANGQQIAFVSRVNAEERADEDAGRSPEPPANSLEARHRKELDEDREKLKADPRIITRLPYRTGTEFMDDRRSHLYVVDIPPRDVAAGADDTPAKPRRITDGEADFNDLSWSADGRYIFSTQARHPDYDPWFHHDVVRLPAQGRRQPFRRLTRPGYDYFAPRPSPNGRWLAVVQRSPGGGLGRIWNLALLPAGGGKARTLTLALDRGVNDVTWSHDSRHIYFTAGDQGNVSLYRVRADDAQPRVELVLGGERMLTGFSLDRANRIAFVAWTALRPGDVYHAAGKSERPLTDFNHKLLSEVALAEPVALRYTAPDGGEIQGWTARPAGAPAGRKLPLVVHVHGGPHVMWGPAMPGMWFEWQLHLANGYAIFYCNPRGADGYGEAFAEAIQRDWGDHVMRDILAGVDLVTARGGIDTKRMALTGGSYAGYMTAWIVGHDQRFACAWSQRGLYNLLSFFGTSDIPQLIEREFEGLPFDDVQASWRQSPLAYVRDIRTPLAIEHQEQDFRVPISEGEQLFAALKRLRRPVIFYRYPREGHEMSRAGEPRHRVDRLTRMQAWFDGYCKPGAKKIETG